MDNLKIKGINYDVGVNFSGSSSTRYGITGAVMENEIKVIKNELHCNAIRIYGSDIKTLLKCSELALKEGLVVWFSPRLMDASFNKTLEYIKTTSTEAEKLRSNNKEVVFVLGTELTLDMKGFIKGETVFERIGNMFKPLSIIKNTFGFGIRKELNKFLIDAALIARTYFNGEITYASGHWENVNWAPFDIISVNYYRNKFNAYTYRKYIKKLKRLGKKVAISEFGCCTYKGAEGKGAWGYSIVDRNSPVPKLNGSYIRDENVQAKYISDLLKIYSEENIYGAFVFNYIAAEAVYNDDPLYDLDMANFGIVKVLPGKTDNPDFPYNWERKKAFYELSKIYSRTG